MLVACAARLTSAVVLAALTVTGMGATGCAPATVSLSADAERGVTAAVEAAQAELRPPTLQGGDDA